MSGMTGAFFKRLSGLWKHDPELTGMAAEELSPAIVPHDPSLRAQEDSKKDSLFAFVDLKDPFTPSGVAGEDLPGPILSVMGWKHFESLFLFHTPHTKERARATESEVTRRFPECRVSLQELSIVDPKDYSAVMARLARGVRDAAQVIGKRNNYVCVSSGTAEMRAAWFLLTAIGLLPARLLQVGTPYRPLFGEANVREVVDTTDWQTVRDLVMPSLFVQEQMRRSYGLEITKILKPSEAYKGKESEFSTLSRSTLFERSNRCSAEDKERVPGLDIALQELSIHVGSAVLRYAAERAGVAAGSALPVLLLGETGTGKERFAHLIHRLSAQASRDMVAINCAAVPKDLAESHFFGHVKGAFSGATADKNGVFEDADQSTLFLDEIAELPLEIQAKLLRVIQDGSYQRLGSTKPRQVRARIIAATNRDLKAEVASGRFREDLYFRLEVIQIKLPALRERRGEIGELALTLLGQINQRRFKPRQLSKEAVLRLERHGWPGNVRELWNVLERSVLYARGDVLQPEDLLIEDDQNFADPFAALPQPFDGFSVEVYLEQARKQLYLRALAASNGNQTQAAGLLGVSKQAVNKFVAGQGDNPS